VVNPTNIANVESVLSQIRQYQAEVAGAANIPAVESGKTQGVSAFADSIKGAVQEVNEAQRVSKAMRSAYERGENIPLTDVVMSMQKSSLAFEATLQIRNKVLKAYEEIMNMPV
jgi:flagellar hook-basal body complex protein FliE